MGKYDPVREFLFTSGRPTVSMSFDELGRLVSGGLPRSAYIYQAWWANEKRPHQPHKQAWGKAGFEVDHLDLNTKRVRFRKVR